MPTFDLSKPTPIVNGQKLPFNVRFHLFQTDFEDIPKMFVTQMSIISEKGFTPDM